MSERLFAVVGLFDTPDALVGAAQRLGRRRDLGRVEAYTPYPVHGLSEALALRRSPLGGMVLVMGVLGAAAAMFFQLWASAYDYPIVTGGKAPWSWEAFVPVMFEVMVAFATFTAGLGMLFVLNRLPFFAHPLLGSPLMAAVTRDRFALALEAIDPARFDAVAARAALNEVGAKELHEIPLPASPERLSAVMLQRLALGIAGACLVAGLAMYWAVKLFPVLPPMVKMQDQPKLLPQRASAFFADGRTQRLPAPGTVARGDSYYDVTSPEQADALANPLPRSQAVFAQGRRAFETYCSVCHGPLGNGVGTLTAAYGAQPANLQSSAIRGYSDGRLYDAIVRGKNAMPSYAADLGEDERWAVVHYVRALQRAQNATAEDLR